MRRDKNDIKWQECKQKVKEMDKGRCLLCQSLSIQEALLFKKNLEGYSTTIIDPAHHLPVSQNIKLMYDPNNVFSLCRQMHERIDHNKDPITGNSCSSEIIESYWQRIIKQREKNLDTQKNKINLPSFFYED